MTLVHASALLASGSKTTHLTVLVHWVDDPVDAWVTADGFVLWVDEDDFVVLVGAVLVDPVAVENTQIGAAAADTLFSRGFERALVLELVDTLIDRLAYCISSVTAIRLLKGHRCVSYRMWHPLALASSYHLASRGYGR